MYFIAFWFRRATYIALGIEVRCNIRALIGVDERGVTTHVKGKQGGVLRTTNTMVTMDKRVFIKTSCEGRKKLGCILTKHWYIWTEPGEIITRSYSICTHSLHIAPYINVLDVRVKRRRVR